jgi:hypothetical protein
LTNSSVQRIADKDKAGLLTNPDFFHFLNNN